MNVTSPKIVMRTTTRDHGPLGHGSEPVLFEMGTVSGVKQGWAMSVRGWVFPRSVHSGAANRGLSSQASRVPHTRTTSYGAYRGTAMTRARRKPSIASPTTPTFVRTASRMIDRRPIRGAPIGIVYPLIAFTRGSSSP